MKRQLSLIAALLLSASAVFAGATTQKWTAGPDYFQEPLNYEKSNVKWSVAKTGKLSVAFTLVGATPNKFYQVGIVFFCTTFATTFDGFPTQSLSGDNCSAITRQGVTKTQAQVYFGAVLTDTNGNGSFTIVTNPLTAATYDVEFLALDGAGCFLNGGGGNGTCVGTFQSPGPTFGDATTITIP